MPHLCNGAVNNQAARLGHGARLRWRCARRQEGRRHRAGHPHANSGDGLQKTGGRGGGEAGAAESDNTTKT